MTRCTDCDNEAISPMIMMCGRCLEKCGVNNYSTEEDGLILGDKT